MTFYKVCRGICNVLFRIFFRFKVIGKEKIPKDGKVIVCANHISLLDPIALAISIPRPINFMAKKNFLKINFLNG